MDLRFNRSLLACLLLLTLIIESLEWTLGNLPPFSSNSVRRSSIVGSGIVTVRNGRKEWIQEKDHQYHSPRSNLVSFWADALIKTRILCSVKSRRLKRKKGEYQSIEIKFEKQCETNRNSPQCRKGMGHLPDALHKSCVWRLNVSHTCTSE